MSEFIVSEVIDGDTFKVKNGWRWNNKVGDIVRPTGYNTPEKWQIGYDGAKTRLTNLILNKIVDIRNALCQVLVGSFFLALKVLRHQHKLTLPLLV